MNSTACYSALKDSTWSTETALIVKLITYRDLGKLPSSCGGHWMGSFGTLGTWTGERDALKALLSMSLGISALEVWGWKKRKGSRSGWKIYSSTKALFGCPWHWGIGALALEWLSDHTVHGSSPWVQPSFCICLITSCIVNVQGLVVFYKTLFCFF